MIFILLADVHHNQHCDADDVETVAAEKVEREETAPLGPSFESPLLVPLFLFFPLAMFAGVLLDAYCRSVAILRYSFSIFCRRCAVL